MHAQLWQVINKPSTLAATLSMSLQSHQRGCFINRKKIHRNFFVCPALAGDETFAFHGKHFFCRVSQLFNVKTFILCFIWWASFALQSLKLLNIFFSRELLRVYFRWTSRKWKHAARVKWYRDFRRIQAWEWLLNSNFAPFTFQQITRRHVGRYANVKKPQNDLLLRSAWIEIFSE